MLMHSAAAFICPALNSSEYRSACVSCMGCIMGLAYPIRWIANEVVQNLWRVRECRLGRDAEISHVAARLPIRVIN